MRALALTLAAVAVLLAALFVVLRERRQAPGVRSTIGAPERPELREREPERHLRAPSAAPPAPPRIEPAAPDAAPYRELEDLAWRQLLEPAEPGVVAGRVLRVIEPVAAAPVLLWAESPATLAEPTAPIAARATASDAAGAFRFEGVASGAHRVRAVLGDERVETRLELDAASPGQSLVLLLGRAVVEGVVHDERGGTLAGVLVTVAGIGPQPWRAVFARTDAAGRFRVGGLIAGRYHVIVDRGGGFDPADERMVTLAVADRAEFVFGRTSRSVQWTSRLVDARGAPIPGERVLTLRHDPRGDERRAWTELDGTFELQLEPGRWVAYLGDGLRTSARIGEALLERPFETAELVHEPALLLVTLRAEGSTLEPGPLHERARELLALRALSEPSPDRAGEPTGAALQWLALPPGRYQLVARPPLTLLAAPDGHVALELDGDVRELTLDVVLE